MIQTAMKEKPVPQAPTDSNPASAATHAVAAEDPAEDGALRKRLLSRMAVAGVVILGLLGGLAVFDMLNKPQAPALPKMATAPIKSPLVTAPEKPGAAVQEESVETVAAAPERTEPALESPKSAKPLTLPATPRTASIKPPAPLSSVAAPAAKPVAPVAQIVEGAKRFLVQVGVFGNHANAEDLLARLQAAGIPAQIESRVLVGPFASRAEADAARAKFKALGIDDSVLVRR